MIICHCHVIRDKDIVKAVEDGYSTLQDIRKYTKACTGCCGCKKAILEILEEAKQREINEKPKHKTNDSYKK